MNEYFVEPEKSVISEHGIEFFLQLNKFADLIVSPHIHTSIEILYITKGRYRVYSDNEEYILSPGDAILFRSHTIHKVYGLDEGTNAYYVLKIKPSLMLDFSSQHHGASYLLRLALAHKKEKTVWKKDECDKNGITDMFSELVREQQNPGYGSDIAMKLISARILLAMLRDMEECMPFSTEQKSTDENLIRRIYNATVYINSHYADDITAEECGRLQFMSYSYFSRSFKRITGQSFKDYLNMTRINHAEKVLMSGDKTITEISSECGFNNVSYFISIYKKLKGVTPCAFRDSIHQ